MVEESVRKTAAKKTVRKAVGRTAAVRRAPRTRAAVVADETTLEPAAPKRTRRKAPTQVAEREERAARSNLLLYIGLGVFALLLTASAVIGFTDRGAINVEGIIESRMASATPEEKLRLEQAQKATANNVPDGGLVASGVPDTPPPPVATTTPETASSTEATASSTEAAAAESEATEGAAEEVPDNGLVPTGQ